MEFTSCTGARQCDIIIRILMDKTGRGKRMSYKVKLEIFEGPFDLLVYLIERAEMNIYDIRISEITEQYLAAIDEYKNQNI